MANRDLISRGITPRGMNGTEAATYVGVPIPKFLELVSDGRMPQPFYLDGQSLWDRFAIDSALNAIISAKESVPPRSFNLDPLRNHKNSQRRNAVGENHPSDEVKLPSKSDRRELLKISDVQEFLGMGRSTIYAQIAAGTFPVPVKIGSKAIRWLRADIDKWRDGLKRAR